MHKVLLLSYIVSLQLYDLSSLSVDTTTPVSQVRCSMDWYAYIKWEHPLIVCTYLLLLFLQPSVCTLYPPHYDAVTSFGIYKDLLFSSCGVTIKQWDIKERSLKHVSMYILNLSSWYQFQSISPLLSLSLSLSQAVDGAHPQGNNINSLATLNSPIMPMLVSGCKGGLLKLWNPENCSNIGELWCLSCYFCFLINII